jgi:CubicO group peptidase (beta-lactamase class C family)
MRLVTQIASLSLATSTSAALCPLLGPVFPPPQSLSSSPSFQAALNGLRSTLDNAFAGGHGSLNPNDTYSVQVFSTSDGGKPLFDFYRRGAGLSDDLDLNGDAIFRIASTSKLITTYLLLLQAGDGIWTEKVTKYIPELSGKQYWDQISVGALAGYISGITSEG